MSSAAAAVEPQLVHATRGRLRIRLPSWTGVGELSLQRQLRRIPGVHAARTNSLTRSAVIQFDPRITDEHAILAAVGLLHPESLEEGRRRPPVHHQRAGPVHRARIGITGLDRDPELARVAIDHVSSLPGVVRATASFLTARVLVEFESHKTSLDDVLSALADLDLPDLPDEQPPAYPLDPAPILQSAMRTVGAGMGLGILVGQQLIGRRQLPLARAASSAAVFVGILQGLPPIRNGLQRILGRNLAEPVLSLPSIVALTLSGSPLGLAVVAVEAVRTLTTMQARRSSWIRYEDQVDDAAEALPGSIIHLDAGDRMPLDGRVLEGAGTCVGWDGLPSPAAPGNVLPAGSRLFGGPFVLELQTRLPHGPSLRPAEASATLYDQYIRLLGPVSLAATGLTALLTRSFGRTIESLVLVNARPAMVGEYAAELSAQSRAIRAGVTLVGTRPERSLRLPHLLLLDAPRTLADGFEFVAILPRRDDDDATALLTLAASVAASAGWPWGGAVPSSADTTAPGSFDGSTARAELDGVHYSLGPSKGQDSIPRLARPREAGECLLVLKDDDRNDPLAFLLLRPRLASGAVDLVESCRRRGVELAMLAAGDRRAAEVMSDRTGVLLIRDGTALEVVQRRQQDGSIVAFVSDGAGAAPAFESCDLAIALSSVGSGHFPARVDMLAPDLRALAAIVEASWLRQSSVRDVVGLNVIANVFGAVEGLRSPGNLRRSQLPVYVATLAALTDPILRMRGGERPRSALSRIDEAKPWRWGHRNPQEVLAVLRTTEAGLTSAQALERRRSSGRRLATAESLLSQILRELTSPLTGLFAAGAALSFLASAPADVAFILATLVTNVGVSVWQEYRAGKATEALLGLRQPSARVLRDGKPALVPATEIVEGDILLLESGDRITADARLLDANGLEIDESALTGESLPVPKTAEGGPAIWHVVLEGSDVITGSGTAVVVAFGRRTLLGATAEALSSEETEQSPLGLRLSRILRQMLPLAAAGSVASAGAGMLHGNPVSAQLAIAVSLFLAAVPEGVPLLARFGEAVVARRLSNSGALVRRVAAVEALGRVDVACVDKTGTITEGRLVLSLVASLDEEGRPAGLLSPDLRGVLLAAALASPSPDAVGAVAHATDAVVIDGARQAGLGSELYTPRDIEAPFDALRGFHATAVSGRLLVKGAPEVLCPQCESVSRQDQTEELLTEATRRELLRYAGGLAARGLRVLMVAEGSSATSIEDPRDLKCLGFLGISDPLRVDVPDAVRRCKEAGIRVVMLTGDHPATASAIASEAGILRGDEQVLTGTEIADLADEVLDRRLEGATVVARVTPLDKLRIIETLQRRGHTVAMTGDGVNDAPALRLADVGVAMGGGTEVARQAADLTLSDNDFATLVEAFVEGRSFWRNMRRSLDLLLGGNLAEIGYVVGASLTGLPALTTRQILLVNMISDILPGVALVMQEPEHRNLASLSREGTTALDKPLRNAIVRRATITASPSLAAFLISLRFEGFQRARTVGFASIALTQLAQDLDGSRTQSGSNRWMLGAVGASAGVLAAALAVPPFRTLLDLSFPTPLGFALITASAVSAAGAARLLPGSAGVERGDPGSAPALVEPTAAHLLPAPSS